MAGKCNGWSGGGIFLVLCALLCLTSCQRYQVDNDGTRVKPAKTAKADPEKEKNAKAKQPPPPKYNAVYDAEIKEIFELASKQRWEEAESKANALCALDPQEPSTQRLLKWVQKQREMKRDQAMEDKIREVNAKNPTFNPTLVDILKEKKDRGLPPRKDVRDAVEQILSTPYIPPSFGKTERRDGVVFETPSEQGAMAKLLDREITIRLENATLESIIFEVGKAEGINFIADKALPAFQQKLSVNLAKVKLSEFLRYISRNLEIQFQVGDGLIWIVDAKDPKKVQEETRIYKLRYGFVRPAEFGPPEVLRTATTVNNVTTVSEQQKMAKFVNDMSPTAPSIESAIKAFFVGAKYYIDYERNIIVARGTREQLEVMDDIVRDFDKPLQQVLIEAKFITVSQSSFLKLGALWETGKDALASAQAPQDFTGLALLNPGLGLEESWGRVLSRQNLSVTLSALQQDGESHILSAPRLTVVNNLPATISDGKIQYYYEEYTVKQTITDRRSNSSLVPAGKPAKVTSGVTLKVLASIGGDGRSIFLALNPEVNQDVRLVTFATITDKDDTGKVVSTFDIKLPESRMQELATRVVVRSGQTVAMGGVLERQQTTYVESVPVLGNLPIIGAAFRRRTALDKPRYLLIFVTATLLSETGEFLSYDQPLEAGKAVTEAPEPPKEKEEEKK